MDPEPERLVELHHAHACNFARYLFPYEEDVELVAAEILCELAVRWNPEHRPGPFWPWAQNGLRWRLIDWWRQQYGRLPSSPKRNLYREQSLPVTERSFPDQLRQKADFERVEETVLSKVFLEELSQVIAKTLTDRELQVLLLRIDGFSLKCIGEHFGFTESRACQISTQARKKIRSAMGRKGMLAA